MTGSHEVNGSIPLCSTIFLGGLTKMSQDIFRTNRLLLLFMGTVAID